MPPELQLRDVEFKFSTGRTAKIRELSGRAQMAADSCAPDNSVFSTLYYRAIMSLMEIEGHMLPPCTGKNDLDFISERITGREIDELLRAYSDEFGAKPADVKKDVKAER